VSIISGKNAKLVKLNLMPNIMYGVEWLLRGKKGRYSRIKRKKGKLHLLGYKLLQISAVGRGI